MSFRIVCHYAQKLERATPDWSTETRPTQQTNAQRNKGQRKRWEHGQARVNQQLIQSTATAGLKHISPQIKTDDIEQHKPTRHEKKPHPEEDGAAQSKKTNSKANNTIKYCVCRSVCGKWNRSTAENYEQTSSLYLLENTFNPRKQVRSQTDTYTQTLRGALLENWETVGQNEANW